jgi:hypothetical protein
VHRKGRHLTPNWFMILMNHRHLFLSMGRSTINALIIDLPMDRNKCLCNEPKKKDKRTNNDLQKIE